MKDQYFGDIHDYHKYGLLRVLQASGDLSLLVAWLLTPEDDGRHGRRRGYLEQPAKWRRYDPDLFDFLAEALVDGAAPAVAMIERSSMLPRARFFSETVPDDRAERARWSDRVLACSTGMDLVFLDPDNGFEVPSTPIGRKDSCKYAAWPEVERLYAAWSSLLAFQFKKVMEETRVTVRRLSAEVSERTGCAQLEVFDAPDVLYFLIAQPRHAGVFTQAVADHLPPWGTRIKVATSSLLPPSSMASAWTPPGAGVAQLVPKKRIGPKIAVSSGLLALIPGRRAAAPRPRVSRCGQVDGLHGTGDWAPGLPAATGIGAHSGRRPNRQQRSQLVYGSWIVDDRRRDLKLSRDWRQ